MNKKEKKSIYINLKSDFGFKRCFGDEKRLQAFLNVILSDDYGRIDEVKIETPEVIRDHPRQRGVTFDLRCKLANGDAVLIEMQNYVQKYYKTRASYYLCTLLDKEIPKGMVWSNMKEDAWMEVIKNLENMENIDPRVYKVADDSLLEMIEKAKVSALTEEEYAEYERSIKEIADAGDAEAYGYERGIEEGIATSVRLLHESGMSTDEISERMKLSSDKVKEFIDV